MRDRKFLLWPFFSTFTIKQLSFFVIFRIFPFIDVVLFWFSLLPLMPHSSKDKGKTSLSAIVTLKRMSYKSLEKEMVKSTFGILYSKPMLVELQQYLENSSASLRREIQNARVNPDVQSTNMKPCDCRKTPRRCVQCKTPHKGREKVNTVLPILQTEITMVDSLLDRLEDILVDKSVRKYVHGHSKSPGM